MAIRITAGMLPFSKSLMRTLTIFASTVPCYVCSRVASEYEIKQDLSCSYSEPSKHDDIVPYRMLQRPFGV